MIKILSVDRGSIAERCGLKKGDIIIRINSEKINDIIDYNFSISDDELIFEVKSGNKIKEVFIKREEDKSLGINVEQLKVRTCLNNCIFCFIDQLPPDARRSLFIKDDDYRASFLYGNFISLSNMTEKDFKRIRRMYLSPIYVSVHTTNPNLRAKMMGNQKCGEIKKALEKLISCNVKIHTQIVLIPDLNDGEEYFSTIEDLASYYPNVISIGVVPVGITGYRQKLHHIKTPTPEWASKIIENSKPFQKEFRRKFGINFLYLADEFYILSGADIPERGYYDDFPQIENGIGMVRKFLDELDEVEIPDFSGRTILVTGVLASKYIMMLEEKFRERGMRADTLVVKNRYFGSSVTVANLLGGWDISGMLYNYDCENVILPPEVLNDDNIFIDNMSFENFRKIVNKRVFIGPKQLSDFKHIIK